MTQQTLERRQETPEVTDLSSVDIAANLSLPEKLGAALADFVGSEEGASIIKDLDSTKQFILIGHTGGPGQSRANVYALSRAGLIMSSEATGMAAAYSGNVDEPSFSRADPTSAARVSNRDGQFESAEEFIQWVKRDAPRMSDAHISYPELS